SLALTSRLTTKPNAPSSPCCRSRTTERRNEGSCSTGRATRNEPASDFIAASLPQRSAGHYGTSPRLLKDLAQTSEDETSGSRSSIIHPMRRHRAREHFASQLTLQPPDRRLRWNRSTRFSLQLRAVTTVTKPAFGAGRQQ